MDPPLAWSLGSALRLGSTDRGLHRRPPERVPRVGAGIFHTQSALTMYFEDRFHELLPVADAAAAVRLVHEGTVKSFQCPVWQNAANQRVCLVDDSHVNC